ARRLGRADRGEDLFGRLGRAARGGDAEDDGLHVLVLDGVVEGFGEVVGADGRAAAERIGAAARAGHDGALAADDGDGAGAGAATPALGRHIVGELDDFGAAPGAAADLGLGLLDLADPVDQLALQGFGGGPGAGLDGGLEGGGLGLAVPGGVGD